jgi:hypothetical protein
VQWSPNGKDFVVVHGCILDLDRDTKDHVVALTSILGLLIAYFMLCFLVVPTALIRRHVSLPSAIDLQKVGFKRPDFVIEQHRLHKILEYRLPRPRAIMETMIPEESRIANRGTFALISCISTGPCWQKLFAWRSTSNRLMQDLLEN